MNWSSSWEDDIFKYADFPPAKVTLVIPIQNTFVQIEAWQVGDLAVHRFIDENGNLEDYWQVTHVPTLTRFDKAVPFSYGAGFNKQALLSWCHKVQLEHKDLWAQLRAFNTDTYKSIDSDLLMKIRKWCLYVEV